MKKLLRCTLVLALVSLAGAQPLAAQRGGLGGFLDWLNKMSGPRMVGPSVSVWGTVIDREGEVPVLTARAGIARRWSSTDDEAISPPGNRVKMWSFQMGPELWIPVDWSIKPALGAGMAIHRFGGDADPFWHASFPVYGMVRAPLVDQLHAVVGTGWHIFPRFNDEDFEPLTVTVPRDRTEAAWWFAVGLELVFR